MLSCVSSPLRIGSDSALSPDRAAATRISICEKSAEMRTCPGVATKHPRNSGSLFFNVCSAGLTTLILPVRAPSVLISGCT